MNSFFTFLLFYFSVLKRREYGEGERRNILLTIFPDLDCVFSKICKQQSGSLFHYVNWSAVFFSSPTLRSEWKTAVFYLFTFLFLLHLLRLIFFSCLLFLAPFVLKRAFGLFCRSHLSKRGLFLIPGDAIPIRSERES